MAACGRKRTLDLAVFGASERPVSGKADIKTETPDMGSANDRFTRESGH